MTDRDSRDDDASPANRAATDATGSTPITSTYKVLGEFDADDGAAVLGQNNASSDTAIGVQGAVPNSTGGFGLATPDKARIDGSIFSKDDFAVVVDGNVILNHRGDNSSGKAGNVTSGHSSNYLGIGVEGATISGGGYDDGTTADPNRVHDDFGTVAGGRDNQAGKPDGSTGSQLHPTVSGGAFNTASEQFATVGGGGRNTASGNAATVPGGYANIAAGRNSFAAGIYANAADDDSFVWNDATFYHDYDGDPDADGLTLSKAVDGEPVTGENTFSVGASGGVRMITGQSSVTYISGGSTGWSNTSSRAAKTNVDPVDTEAVLDGVMEAEIATWEYEDEDGDGAGVTHIGPMAEDFHDIVEVGDSDDHINSINADGVLFAAVQGLNRKFEAEKTALREDLEERDDRIAELEAENEELRERNAELEARLAAVEDRLGLDGPGDRPTPADD